MEALLHKLSTMDTKLKFNADYPVHVIKQKKTNNEQESQNKMQSPWTSRNWKNPLKIHAFK